MCCALIGLLQVTRIEKIFYYLLLLTLKIIIAVKILKIYLQRGKLQYYYKLQSLRHSYFVSSQDKGYSVYCVYQKLSIQYTNIIGQRQLVIIHFKSLTLVVHLGWINIKIEEKTFYVFIDNNFKIVKAIFSSKI